MIKHYWMFLAMGLEENDYCEFWASGLDMGLTLIFQEVYTRIRKANVVMMIHDVWYILYIKAFSGCVTRAFDLSMLQKKDEAGIC